MAHFQEIARVFAAAGGVSVLDGEGEYNLYTDNGSLISKHWNGAAFVSEELIAKSVRPGSTASYTITPAAKHIFYISDDNTLRVLRYDNDEEEWVAESAPRLEVHPEGNVYAVTTGDTSILAVFQNAAGKLIALNESWTTTELPAHPVGGTPITISFFPNGIHIFYIATDEHIHDLALAKDWLDSAAASASSFSGSQRPKRILASPTASDAGGSPEYVLLLLTKGNELASISSKDGEKSVLGTVDGSGKYTAKTSAESASVWAGTGSGVFPRFPRHPPPFYGTWEDLYRRQYGNRW